MFNTAETREDFRSSKQKLARARRLYIFLTRRYFDTAGNDYFDWMVDRMKETGLYSAASERRGIRMSLIAHIFKIKYPRFTKSGTVYREWLFKVGIDCHSGYFKPIIKSKAIAD